MTRHEELNSDPNFCHQKNVTHLIFNYFDDSRRILYTIWMKFTPEVTNTENKRDSNFQIVLSSGYKMADEKNLLFCILESMKGKEVLEENARKKKKGKL